MTSCGDMAGVAARPLLVLLLAISTVLGCGQLPQGLERNMTFNVTGFTLPVAMFYTNTPAVNDVLEQEGRNALLLPGVISLILQQLTVQISYNPLKCDVAFDNPAGPQNNVQANMDHCIIISNTVTATCNNMVANHNCAIAMPNIIQPIPSRHLTISGSLTIVNPIMAGWSREMWQSVLNRVA